MFSPAHGSASRAAAPPGAASQKLSARRGPRVAPAVPLCFRSRPRGGRRAREPDTRLAAATERQHRAGPGSRSAPRRGRRGGVGREGKGGKRGRSRQQTPPQPGGAAGAPQPGGLRAGAKAPAEAGLQRFPPAFPSWPASARPAAPSTSPRRAEIPQGGGWQQPPYSPGAATFPGAVSALQGAPGPGLGPGARAPSAASGLLGLAGPRALSARRAATCPRVAGKARRQRRRGTGGGAALLRHRRSPGGRNRLQTAPSRSVPRSIMG